MIPLFGAARAKGRDCFVLLYWGNDSLPEMSGIYVQFPQNEIELWQSLRRFEPNIILLEAEDCSLSLIEEIKHKYSLPIVLIAHSKEIDEKWIKECYQAGIDDVVYRPFKMDEILEISYLFSKLRNARGCSLPSLSE